MIPEQEQRANEILEGVLCLPPEEHQRYLDEACGGDAALRGLVDTLLAHDAAASRDGFLANPATPNARPIRPLPQLPGYEVLSELGRGGMGVVYQAHQTGLKRLVALKVVRDADYADASERGRLRAEAESIARLQHPNIVQVFEVGEHQGLPYFALEFCPGGSLAEKLTGTPLLSGDAAALVETLAQAMHAAHEKGIIHRDLKPANVLLAEGGTPKVADFGLAKQLDKAGQTMTGAVLGTASYMAPEQAGGASGVVGPAADVYALGAILYECLTGRPPFKAATLLETLHQVRAQEVVPARSLNGQIPRDLETICSKSLHKDPARRYASAAALAEDLRRFRAGEPITARPVGASERGWRWCRRNPVVAGLLAAVAITLLAGTTGTTLFAVVAGIRADEATRARQDVERTNEALGRSREMLEQTAARGLLGPLGSSPPSGRDQTAVLSAAEIEALWELSATPDEALRRRFIREGIRDKRATEQLQSRAAFALHAAVGLDSRRRDDVERILLERLNAEGTPPEHQITLALTLAQFDGLSPSASLRAAEILTKAIRETTDIARMLLLARGLHSLAARMEPQVAATAAAGIVQTMETADDPRQLGWLSSALAGAAARMEPGEAAVVCTRGAAQLTRARDQPFNAPHLKEFSEGFGSIARYMEPLDVARIILDETSRTSDPDALSHFASTLEGVLSRLDDSTRASACSSVVDRLAESISHTTDLDSLERLCLAVASLAPELVSAKAAAKVCGRTATALADAMTRTNDSFSLMTLSSALVQVADLMDPEEAAAVCSRAVSTLTSTTNHVKDDFIYLSNVSTALSGLADRLRPEEAIKVRALAELKRPFKTRMALPAPGPGCLVPLPGHEPDPKEEVATVLQSMRRAEKARTMAELSKQLVAWVGRLDASEAAVPLAQAATLLTDAMSKNLDPDSLIQFADGLAALADRMAPRAAAAPCARAAAILVDALSRSSEIHYTIRLGECVSRMILHVEPGRGDELRGRAAAVLLQTMAREGDPELLESISKRLEALLTGQELSDKKLGASAAVAVVGSVLNGCGPLSVVPALSALPHSRRRSSGALSTQQLVELLKLPTCVGQVRHLVLDHLGNRYRRRFADQWEFVRFAEEQNLGLDFTTSPKRPE